VLLSNQTGLHFGVANKFGFPHVSLQIETAPHQPNKT
jgi:hypothetical protein